MRDRLRRLRLPPPSAAGDSAHARRVAVTALVLVLLLATAAAFAVTERLKLQRSPVTAPRLERLIGPTCGCPRETAELAVTLRRPDTVDVSIVDMDRAHVRTLATGERRQRGVARFRWDGRDDDGAVVADGRYRLRLELADADRTIVVPTPIRVDATPPRIRLLAATPEVFSPDGDRKRDRVVFEYRASEESYSTVYVDGRSVVRGMRRRPGPGSVRWRGRIEGKVVRPGTYTVWLTAVDAAGNESEPSDSVSVTVR